MLGQTSIIARLQGPRQWVAARAGYGPDQQPLVTGVVPLWFPKPTR